MIGSDSDKESAGADTLVACHECDALHRREPIPKGARADCVRCGRNLYSNIPNTLDRSIALFLSSLILLTIANAYPFLAMKAAGRMEVNQVFSGGFALYEFGMGELGLVVFLTSILFPFVTIIGTLYLLLCVRAGFHPPAAGPVFRTVNALAPWSLIGVFMLGTLISIVKLQDLATVVPGIGLYALAGTLLVFSAARANLDPDVIWTHSPQRQLTADQVNAGDRVLNCHACGLLRVEGAHGEPHACPRCGAAMHHRVSNSIERTWALMVAAAVMLIPANLLPVLNVQKLGQGQPDTIMSGVIHLIEGGMWGLALIVFFASVVVPALKLLTLGFLLHSVQSGSNWRPRDRTFLYRVTEVIGAWSMVDVFLVGLLSGLVRLGLLATVEPGLGASFFGAAVILTMFAAHNFDSRLIWDRADLRDDAVTEGGEAPA